jgi:subtilisin
MSSFVQQELEARGVAQVLVVLKQPPTGTAAAARVATRAKLDKLFVYSELSQSGALEAAAVARQPGTKKARSRKAPSHRYYPHLGVMLGTVDKASLAALKKHADVDAVHGAPPISPIWPERVAAAALTTNLTWGLRQMGVEELWDAGFKGQDVLVGHLDTGVDANHPALSAAVAAFAEFDLLGAQIPGAVARDSGEHGTHTAATIAGRPVNGRAVGVAPGAKLACAMVIEGGNAFARVLGGMDWVIGRGARVLSMSLGFRGWFDDFLALTERLRELGVLPVFAVGNEGPGTSRSPGNYVEALSVGAVGQPLAVPAFSSSQRFQRARDPLVPDVVAPGVDIISAKPGGGYQSMDGTSMATPHVAGLAALLIGAVPGASVDQVEDAIFNSCSPQGLPPDRANRGLVNAPRALAILQGSSSSVSARRPRKARKA